MDILQDIALTDIIPDPSQPRKDFDTEKLNELAESIRAVGVIQPIRVRRNPNMHQDASYMIIAGERRWQASGLAGKLSVPAVVVSNDAISQEEIYAQQLTENLHRQDLNPVEKAEFINGRIQYLKEKGFTNATEQAATELGVSPSWISKNTAILKYAPEIRALARDGKLRDYSLLKKISELKGDKRETAIDLINEGSFNAKEFFSRKRYDKKVKTEAQEDSAEGVVTAAVETQKPQKKRVVDIAMIDRDLLVGIIKKTGYQSMLETVDFNWQSADDEAMSRYAKSFKDWVLETQ